jgi:hypothetical protein
MAIAIHPSSPALVTGGFEPTTASFSPPAGSLLVACSSSGPAHTVSNSGTARTWTQRVVRSGTKIFTAPNPTALTNTTVKIVSAGGPLKVFVLTGVHPTTFIGQTGNGASTTNNVTVSGYSATAAGSMGVLLAPEFNNLGLPTSTDDEIAYSDGSRCGLVITKTATTAGQSITFNLDAFGAAAADWTWVALELLADSLDAAIDATTVDAAADIPNPGVSAGATISIQSVDAQADIDPPDTSAGQTAHPDTVTAQGEVPPPTVAAGSAELINVATVEAGADIAAPDVSAGATIAAETVDATANLPAPSITATRQTTINPATVEARADIGTPELAVPFLPGQTITGDFQIEWAEQHYGGYGNVYQVLAGSVEGWDDLPALDSDSAIRPSRHGAWPGTSLAQQREVSAIIAVDDPDTFVTSLRALRRATAVAEDDAEYALVIRTYGEALLAYGAISARVIPAEHYGQGWAQASLRWTCSDPRRYSLVQQSVVVAADGTETLANNGDTATSPRFRILGPAVNPVLLNETRDRILGIDITLSGGQLLEIDTQLGTVMVGDTSRMSTLSGESVPVEDFTFAPGNNVITYETDSGGTAGAEAIWRSAYL